MFQPDKVFLGFIIGINLLAFWYYRKDKLSAINKKKRTSEKFLLTVAFLGGAYGALLGMLMFRHKTKHARFVVLIPIFVILWSLILWYIYLRGFLV